MWLDRYGLPSASHLGNLSSGLSYHIRTHVCDPAPRPVTTGRDYPLLRCRDGCPLTLALESWGISSDRPRPTSSPPNPA